MTYSIIAHDPRTAEIGVAVASRFFACGAAVPYLGARCAVATQAFVNPIWGVEGRARLATGESAETVLADLVARDEGRAIRQCHMMDAQGRFAAHTGASCVDWAGHLVGARHSVAGNMLVSGEVIEACFSAYLRTEGTMAERLLAAMEAGEAAGGDKRGRQAAGLTVHRGQDYPYLSLRVDDDADPLSELRRLLDVAGERYLHVAEAMPTAENFSGLSDCAPIDRAITEAEARRAAEGRASRSRATETGA
ncbi:DUF1028 domain-containing protein [Limimaricola soesokkakensis]|uniref:DUF1028 domain-containing protein n=1 Tax=Limimaricola soesokkakensis TaxID=1343159 RepID=UPI003516FFF5